MKAHQAEERRRLLKRARDRHGIFSLKEWLQSGSSRRQLDTLIHQGFIERVHYKVYTLADVPRTFKFWTSAGCIKAGPVAAAYGATAAALQGIYQPRLPVHIATRRKIVHTSNTRFHHVSLPEAHISTTEGIQVTNVQRTLLDACAELHPKGALRLIHSALRQKLTTPEALNEFTETEARSGRSGVAVMRAHLLELDRSVARSRSDLENQAYELFVNGGMPTPQRNYLIDSGRGFPWEVDLYWRLKLVIEVDDPFTHLDLDAFDRDRQKDLELKRLGYTVVRVTKEMMANPDRLLRDVKSIYAELEHRQRDSTLLHR